MKKLIYLFAALSLLFAACEKDDAQPAEPPVPCYSLLSMEYGDLLVVATHVTEEEVYCNNSDLPIPVEYTSESEKGYTSLFMPVGMPKGKIAASEVPVPQVDWDGTPRVSIVRKTPFRPYEPCAFSLGMTVSKLNVDLPPHTRLRAVAKHLVYQVEAPFVCRLRDSFTGDTIEVQGTWNGVWKCGAEDYITYTDID